MTEDAGHLGNVVGGEFAFIQEVVEDFFDLKWTRVLIKQKNELFEPTLVTRTV